MRILDELVELTGWHRDHARKALCEAGELKVIRPRPRRPPLYGPSAISCLVICWTLSRAPSSKRLAPMLSVLVPLLRRDGELDHVMTVKKNFSYSTRYGNSKPSTPTTSVHNKSCLTSSAMVPK